MMNEDMHDWHSCIKFVAYISVHFALKKTVHTKQIQSISESCSFWQ